MTRTAWLLLVFGSIGLLATPARAGDFIWASAGGGTWSTSANWIDGAAPTSSDTVTFRGFQPLSTSGWTASGSTTLGGSAASNAIDKKRSTHWACGNSQSTDDWFKVDMTADRTFVGVDIDAADDYPLQYPRNYKVEVSSNNSSWTQVATGSGSNQLVEVRFTKATARYIRVTLTGANAEWWEISEFTVWGTTAGTQFATAAMTPSGSASAGGAASNALDFNNSTVWSPGAPQVNGQWYKVDMGANQTFTGISMDAWSREDDYPRGYNVEVSTNNSSWTSVATGNPTTTFVMVTFAAQTARYIRVTQTSSASNWWSMYEFRVYGTPSSATTSGNTTLAGIQHENDTTFVQASGHTLTVNGDWTQSDGAFTGGNSTVHITGDFTLSGTGAFTSTSGRLNVGGAFTNTGTFTHNSGRVMLAATSSKTFATNGQTFNDVIINDGLVGYWKLDEGSSPIADSSEYGHSGTLYNTPTWMAGPTLQFTNSNSMVVNGSSQYGRISRSPALEPTAVSVSVWVRRNGAQVNNAKVMSKTLNNNFASPWASYEIHVNNSGSDVTRVNWQTGHVGGALNMLNSATNALPNTTWVHVVGVYDPSASAPQKKLYVNGVLSASATVSTDLLYDATSTGDLYLGMNGGSAQYFNGAMDDLRVYGRALSATDVEALYAGDFRVTPAATHTLSGALTAAGELVIVSGTLDVSAAACSSAPCAVSVGESWRNLGGLFTPRTGTVSFTGAGGSLLSDRLPFYNLTVSGTGTWTLSDRLYVDNALTMSANGTLATATYPIHAGTLTKTTGTISGSGRVVLDAASNKLLTVNNLGVPLRIESPLDNGLVGYWKLDEGRGTTAYDLAGNGYNATLYNDPIWSSSVPTSPAIPIDDAGSLTFDGTDQYARVSRNATLEPTSVTVAAWVKRIGTQVLHAKIVNKTYNNSATAPFQSYALQMSNDADSSKVRFEIGLVGATTSGIGSATAALPDGTWVHVVGVYDPAGAAPQQRLYINGALSASATLTTALLYHTTVGDLYFGQNGGSSQYFDGMVDDVRVYNRGLSANEVTALYTLGYTTGSTAVYSLNATATMGSTLTIDSGILDAVSYQNSITGATTVNGGEYIIGSNTSGQTFTGGLAVNRYGELTLASSGGKVIMGASSTLAMDGTLTASNTGAAIQSASSTYNFRVGTVSGATPVLNITGLQVKSTTANGMYINYDTGATTTFTRFDNIAFSLGAGTGVGNYNLRIYATALSLTSNGCTFDNGASKSVEKNVYLVGNGHSGSPDSTTTRAFFGGSTCANSNTCEGYDGDDDNNATPDGVADNLVNGGSVIQWVASALADTSGSIEGFPTAAFNWSNFSYYATYVAYHDTDGSTADTVYVRTSTGAADYSWSTALGEEIIGTPRWDTVGGIHYVYVAVTGSAGTGGKVYRLIDDTVGNTLGPDTGTPWNGGNNPYACSCTITTPLAQDTNNLYWGGWVAGPTHKLWALVKTTRSLVGAAFNTTYATYNTAPAIWSTSPTYAFLGLAGHIVKFNVTSLGMSDDNTNPGTTTPVTGRITIIFNKLYAGDDNGWFWSLDPSSMVGTAKYWGYRNHASAIKSHYFDPAYLRAYFGDQDGHIMVVNSSGTAVSGYPWSTGSGAFATAPYYNAGVIVAGTTTGTLYFIDQNTSTMTPAPAKIQTYEFGSSNAISGIGYDPVTGRYMVSTANATTKDGKLYYFATFADPTAPL